MDRHIFRQQEWNCVDFYFCIYVNVCAIGIVMCLPCHRKDNVKDDVKDNVKDDLSLWTRFNLI